MPKNLMLVRWIVGLSLLAEIVGLAQAPQNAGTITTFAGGGTVYGDGGPATSARIFAPGGIAIDQAGNVYVADAGAGDFDGNLLGGNVVRRIDAATGIITTVAGINAVFRDCVRQGGIGVGGTFDGDLCGDGGPATSASFSAITAIAVDLSGNLYIVDYANQVVRKVDTATGIITKVAGGGAPSVPIDDEPTFEGDGGPATSAVMFFPTGVAVDAAGNLYIADSFNFRIRKVDAASGIIQTIAGSLNATVANNGSGGDGGPALLASFGTPSRVAADFAGNVYVLDMTGDERGNHGFIRRIDAATGIITTVAGGGSGAGESGRAVDADLREPRDLALDNAGNLYIAGELRVWKVDAAGGISVFAGTGGGGGSSTGDGGPAIDATFCGTGGVGAAGNGDVYISDCPGSGRVRKVASADTDGDSISDALDNCPLAANADQADADADGIGDVCDALSDTDPPSVTCPANIVVMGAALSGVVVNYPAATATDAVDPAPLIAYSQNSGTLFPIGTTTITITATDASANSASCSFTVSVSPDIIIDATTPQSFLEGLTSVAGSIVMNGVTGRTSLVLPNLTSVGGSVIVTSNPDLTTLLLPVLATVSGDFIVSGNPLLQSVDITVSGGVGGSANMSANSSATAVDIVITGGVGGSTTVSDNSAAANVDIVITGGVGGSATVSDNSAAATVDIVITGGVGGSATVSDNSSAAAVDVVIGSGVGGSVAMVSSSSVGNTTLSVGTTVAGDVTISSSSVGNVTLSVGTTVAGDVSISSSSVGNVTLNVGTTVAGDVTISTGGTSVSGTTADGTTAVTVANGSATMTVVLPENTFSTGVPFSIQSLGALADSAGTDASSSPVTVSPMAAYQFAFEIPTLNADATLTFDMNVGALDAESQAAFLTALASNSATLAVRNDTAGSAFQAFAVCVGGELPTAGGCVAIQRFDATGAPLAAGDPTVPGTVRFTGVTGRFSTFALVIVTPIPDTTAPVVSGFADVVAEATSPAGAAVSYVTPTAVDDRDGAVAVSCAPGSGSVFALGSTIVNCSAADAAGNTGQASFVITVRDTTAPALSVPASVTVDPTSATGAVVNYPVATATDLVDGTVTPTCLPGADFFPIGSTTVKCRATDGHGNTSTGAFDVIVRPLTFVGPLAPYVPPPSWFKAGRALPIKWRYSTTQGVLDTPNANPSLSISGPFGCSTTDGGDPIPADASGNSGYQYDAATRTWQFNWKVPSTLAGGCYAITIRNQQADQTDGPFIVRIGQ